MSDLTPIPGERVPTTVRRSILNRGHIVTLAIGGAMALGVIVYVRMPDYHKKTADDATNKPPAVGAITPWTPPPIQQVVLKPPPPAPPPPPALAQAVAPPAAQAASDKSDKVQRPAMLAFAPPAVPEALKPHTASTPPSLTPTAPQHTAVAYEPKAVAGVKAGPFGDSALKLKPGLLRCTMETRIISDQPGPFLCHLPGDALTDQGVPVMRRGTRVIGTYDTKNANQQDRLAGISLTAYTPNGCVVPLSNSPMADTLGGAGIEGERDTHFWQKFGFALILTAVNIGTQLGQAALSHGNNNTYLSFGGDNGITQFTTDVLRDKMQIHDTIRVNQGEDVAVFLTQPTDFSDCIQELAHQ